MKHQNGSFCLEILQISKNTSILVGDNVAKWDYVKWGDRTPVRGGGDVITGGILKALLGHCWTTLKHFSIFLESQTPRQKWNSIFWLNISSLLSLLEILGVCEWFSPDLRIPKMRSTKKEQCTMWLSFSKNGIRDSNHHHIHQQLRW